MVPIIYKNDTVLRNGMQYHDVEFLEDFGIFKQGFKTSDLYVFYKEGVIRSFNPNIIQKFDVYPVVPKEPLDLHNIWKELTGHLIGEKVA